VLNWWEEVLNEYSFDVSQEFTLSATALKKLFTCHNRVPCGLPNIMMALKKQQKLATKADIISGALFEKSQTSSYMGQLASYAYSSTFGYFSTAPQE